MVPVLPPVAIHLNSQTEPVAAASRCHDCGGASRLLTAISAVAWVNYLRCDGCGQVWTSDKQTGGTATRVSATREL